MILYHIDRKKSFPSEKSRQLIRLSEIHNTEEANLLFAQKYCKGISNLGRLYLNPFSIIENDENVKDTIVNNYRIFTIEYVFEIVRQIYYPMLPSRFESLFACESKEDIKLWYELLKVSSDAVVRKIQISREDTFICDAAWRDKTLYLNEGKNEVFSPFAYHELAKYYWSGKIIEKKSQMEVLCKLPVTVIDSIPMSDFL